MKKENFEEGIKRIAIVIWFIWVVYIFFSDSFTYNINLGTAYYDYGPEYFNEVCFTVENLKILDYFSYCLKFLFKRFFGFLINLGIILLLIIVLPAIIYFAVKFIWIGFTKNWDDKNK